MRSYEKILIVGNIGSVEQLHSKAGNSYLRMSVAVNRITGNQSTPVWYSVLVEGRPQSEGFIKKDGTAGVDNSIIAEKLPLLMDAPPPQAAAQAAQRAAA
jgi:single-stranded DNA-binding protein